MSNYGSYGGGAFSPLNGWRRMWNALAHSTARFLFQIGLVLLVISILIFLFPRLVAWLLALGCLIGAGWFFLQAYRIWQVERRWSPPRIYDVQDFYEIP